MSERRKVGAKRFTRKRGPATGSAGVPSAAAAVARALLVADAVVNGVFDADFVVVEAGDVVAMSEAEAEPAADMTSVVSNVKVPNEKVCDICALCSSEDCRRRSLLYGKITQRTRVYATTILQNNKSVVSNHLLK